MDRTCLLVAQSVAGGSSLAACSWLLRKLSRIRPEIRVLLFYRQIWHLMLAEVFYSIFSLLGSWLQAYHSAQGPGCVLLYQMAELGLSTTVLLELHLAVSFCAIAWGAKNSFLDRYARLLYLAWLQGPIVCFTKLLLHEARCTGILARHILIVSLPLVLAAHCGTLLAAISRPQQRVAGCRAGLYSLGFLLTYGPICIAIFMRTPTNSLSIEVALEKLGGLVNVCLFQLQIRQARKLFEDPDNLLGVGLGSWVSEPPTPGETRELRADSTVDSTIVGGKSLRTLNLAEDELMSVLAYLDGADQLSSYKSSIDHPIEFFDTHAAGLAAPSWNSRSSPRGFQSVDTPPDQPITVLEQLVAIQQELGRGSFSSVYLVRSLANWSGMQAGNWYAMKTMNKKYFKAKGFMRYAYREREILKVLKHPCLVELVTTLQVSKPVPQWILVLDFCAGGSIERVLSAYPPPEGAPEPLARRLLAEVLMALEHLHSQLVLHRDLKPGNVLLSGRGRHCKVADFGLSRQMEAEDMVGMSFGVGTYSYMAPERVEHNNYGLPVDIYSWGVLALELTGGEIFALEPCFSSSSLKNVPNARVHPLAKARAQNPDERGAASSWREDDFFAGVDWAILVQRCADDEVEESEEHYWSKTSNQPLSQSY